MNASPAVRSVRAAVFAALCVTLAASGHGLAVGAMPPAWAAGAGFAAIFALGCLLGGRERSLPQITVAMLAVQGGLHLAFDAAAMSPMNSHGTHATTAAHIAAALVASWWLRRGEAAFWSLLRGGAAALVPGLAAWWRARRVPVAGPAVRPVPHGPHRVRRFALRCPVSRRGPPRRTTLPRPLVVSP
jgi:hypothetical protein